MSLMACLFWHLFYFFYIFISPFFPAISLVEVAPCGSASYLNYCHTYIQHRVMMLHCIALHCIVLYCTALYCIELHCIILYSKICCTTTDWIQFNSTHVLCCTIKLTCITILFCAVLCVWLTDLRLKSIYLNSILRHFAQRLGYDVFKPHMSSSSSVGRSSSSSDVPSATPTSSTASASPRTTGGTGTGGGGRGTGGGMGVGKSSTDSLSGQAVQQDR